MKLSEIGSNNSYSHIPILEGLLNFKKIERVLELGCGTVSTPFFLSSYPDLKYMLSIENNPPWGEQIRNSLPFNPVWELRIKEEPVAQTVLTIDLTNFDLCLIDDALAVTDRVNTIGAVTAKYTNNILIVIHDYEQPGYAGAVRGDLQSYNFHQVLPNTGLVWAGDVWSHVKCEELLEFIR